ncbi:hypothetical protein M3_0215 [Lysinibacillus phage vB_LfM_LysYB1]|nr:hypothetical protein M3_0215 [Lysinibacillus phage vB_LfM_LysYB1]WAB25273.1 hypothetical protein M5_0095 [Lysinibacillus phage vB_LfM_LysYB2]
MSNRVEVCIRAREMAEEYGGKPADYMGEAWKEIKSNNPEPGEYEVRTRQHRGRAGRKLLGSFASRAWSSFKEGSKGTANDLNFMKAPKDSPDYVFQKAKSLVSGKPSGMEIPQSVKSEVKRMFKFW